MSDKGRDVDALGATVALDEPCGEDIGSAATVASDGDPRSLASRIATKAHAVSGTFPGSHGDIDLRPFGPYTIVEALGDQGSMGIVARGYNQAFDRWELLKFLRADHALDPSRVRQFHREGRVLAKLSHPNVVQVFAIYQMEGRPCLAMEFLRGDSLAKLVQRHEAGLPLDRWYALFLDAARGLSAAHQVGLLHRDLKPDNLFVVDDHKGGHAGLKLIDFGLATADQTRRQDEPRDSLVADLSGGTPVYMAPELWSGEMASPRTDIFALGLTFTFAAVGRLPFQASTIVEALNAITSRTPFPDPREARPDLPKRLADVLRKATAKPVEERFATVDDLVAALIAAWDLSRPRSVPGSGPYRGLRPYAEQERDVFFGRDEEIADVLERMRLRGGVVVVGPSGSGKTSLVQAGVVPAILDGALGNQVTYQAIPIVPGRRPLRALAAAVAAVTQTPEDEIVSFLSQSPERLGSALRESLGEGKGFVVVVDPLEALADDAVDPTESRAACIAVASLLEPIRPELRLLAAVRADRMDRLFAVESLRSWLTHGFHPIRPLRGSALRSALIEPARTAGFELENAAIIDDIVAEAEGLETGLPLVSFAMHAWWEHRDEARKVLPTAAWQKLGGVAGALVRHAESVVEALDRDLRAAVEAMLIRLVRSDGTRRRVARKELLDPGAAMPRSDDALVVLLQTRIAQESFDQVEIAHDALVARWPRLQALLETAGEDRAFRERLTSAAGVWESQGHPDGALWTGEQAAQLQRWLSATKATLTQVELAFAEAVQRRTARRRLVLRSVIVCVLLVAVGFVIVAKTNERAMASKLEGAVAERNQAHEAFKKAEASRLRLLAETLVSTNPRQALRLAAQSYELENNALVDVIAWRAHAQGVPHPIPAPAGGASVVQFSNRGQWLALGGDHGSVVLLATTKESHRLLDLVGDDVGAVSALAISPDERSIAVGTVGGWFGVAALGEKHAKGKKLSSGAVRSITWTAEGIPIALCRRDDAFALVRVDAEPKTLAEGSLLPTSLESLPFPVLQGDSDLRWVDAAGDVERRALNLGDAVITSLHGHAPTRSLALGAEDGRVWFLGPKDGKLPPSPIATHDAAVRRVRLSPDGQVLLSMDVGGRVRLASVHGALLHTLPSAREAFVWLPKRSAVGISTDAHTAELWSTRTGEVVAELHGLGDTVLGLDVDPVGRWLVAATEDGVVRAYALEEAAWRVERGASTHAPERCAVAPDGATVACAWPDRVDVEHFDPSGRKSGRRSFARTDEGAVVALSVDGYPGKVSWSTTKNAWTEGDATAHPPVLWQAYAGRESKLAVVTQRGSRFSVAWGEQEVVSLDRSGVLAVASDASAWLATNEANEVLVIDANGDIATHRFDAAAKQDRIISAAWTDDGETFAVATQLGRLGLGRTKQERIAEVGRLRGGVSCLSFARSGRTLLAASSTGIVAALDTQSQATLFEHLLPSPVLDCARSAVEDRFAFVSRDGSVRTRWLDLAPLATSELAEAQTEKPSLDRWAGLPTERAW